ncbi:MAG: ABC transporter permease [Chloroflexi bacterium]|jgi:simple sugar transport system permease protein|uniref:ABC transporter permease n=1 Tax=Candidatus Thermofonsia Clade 3 bacterium TaxID=2364212 RepID=A0A2M8QDK4_9CHLR|nr:ABC transporter permease [Candidatus Roseilinea sp. NK_OTU-006]PJF47895.1 MAG: ABC transporter permease [Candidatus Thermofonsia Clade 3 bacterium]RMG65542.1 MAG: ABC transporter permease [Chloroflexota bacterium]
MEQALQAIFSATFVAAVLRVTTPILLPALGGLIAELGGVANIALEGIMLISACAGVLVSIATQSEWLGLLAGLAAGIITALVLAFFHLDLKADIILSAIAINILASGGTIFVVFLLTGDKGSTSALVSRQMPFIEIPIIKDIPLLGPILSGQNLLTYIAFIAVAGVAIFLYRMRAGIHLRAVGENPDAARSVGINVRSQQYLALALSGALAALGGVYLSMGYVKFFARDMTAGRGFIALAAIFLGGKTPLGTMIAALVFGLAEALSVQLGNLRVPNQLVQMIPYIATLIALVVYALVQRQRAIAHQRRFRQAPTP